MESMKISISAGNRKMGAIPSVSLVPIVTCPAGVPCAKKCYACRLCRIRKTVSDAYERNYDILIKNPAAYWAQVKAAAMVTRYFRFHVAGDIPTADYFAEMVKNFSPSLKIMASLTTGSPKTVTFRTTFT